MTPGRFDVSSYETVDERLHRWWADHPDGRVATRIITAEEGRYIVEASIWSNAQDEWPVATGLAEEIQDSGPINSRWALENAETSALGRCLANAGYSKLGARPSQTEMLKGYRQATNAAKDRVLAATAGDVKLARTLWKEAAGSLGHSPDDDLDPEEAEKAAGIAVSLAAEQAKLTIEKPSKKETVA